MIKRTLSLAILATTLTGCISEAGPNAGFNQSQPGPSPEQSGPTLETPAIEPGDNESGANNPGTNPVVTNPVGTNPVVTNPGTNPVVEQPNTEQPVPAPTPTDPAAEEYVSGASYNVGDVVRFEQSNYQCLVAGWCSSSSAAYHPETGFAWQQAWKKIASDSGNTTPSVPVENEPVVPPVEEPNEQPNQPGQPSTPVGETPEQTPNNGNPNQPDSGNEETTAPTAGAGVNCLPQGLAMSKDVTPNYCDIYDAQGIEKMGDDHPRRIIGYFTSWRNGTNDQPSFLVNDIPWDKITHINYAFAHIDKNYQLSVGDVTDENNPATGLTWENIAGAEMDSEFAYNGHFNLLNKYKKSYPDVKTLISVGGWAETGGHFTDDGRAADGGFYTLTTNADGSVNHAAINTFAKSSAQFIRQYGFDGLDVDYEYPTSMQDAGHPDDFHISNARRGDLWQGYMALMKALRLELDKAGEADNTHYLLTIASPSSGYLLRGMEAFQAVKYLDYVNIMSYDLHGAWNEFVGPNAALFDAGNDAELVKWNTYSTNQYEGIGYLNTDWAYHYFRGAMQAGRINIGIPYYSRGWQNVQGGTHGLWGSAKPPAGYACPKGTFGSCGYGAQGIDNLWHDLDETGSEIHSGTNPLWHTMNLKEGIAGSYLSTYGVTDAMEGVYQRHYDDTLVAPWLWNAEKKVFLSIEDEQSFAAKLDWVIDNGIGGVMFWEMAGDYRWDADKGEYFMGDTLTTLAYNRLSMADAYEYQSAEIDMPETTIDVTVEITDFDEGDSNYPISPKIKITNNTDSDIIGGSIFSFDVGTSTSSLIKSWSGHTITVINDGSNKAGNNIGGLDNDMHRVSIELPGWQTLAPGESIDVEMVYYLPAAMPSNWVVHIGQAKYALQQEYPNKLRVVLP